MGSVKLGLVRKGKKYITNMKVQKVMADAPQQYSNTTQREKQKARNIK
jgi:hypothetical protein